jgi:hypothetical protein
MKFLILLLFAIVISSCCTKDQTEIGRVELSEQELELIPYLENQEILFKHSSGNVFPFTVTDIQTDWKKDLDYEYEGQRDCCGCSYTSYETKYLALNSTYPNFNIGISISAIEGYYDEYKSGLQFQINSSNREVLEYDSLFNFVYDTQDPYTNHYDTVMLNNENYFNVIEREILNNIDPQDSTSLYVKSFMYNELGLLQIKMSNDETYSIFN